MVLHLGFQLGDQPITCPVRHLGDGRGGNEAPAGPEPRDHEQPQHEGVEPCDDPPGEFYAKSKAAVPI